MKLEKITDGGNAGRRRYEDACGAAHAMDLLGERWALFVVRELMFGGKRFSDLRASLPGISANVLTQRLEGLEQAGVLTRRRLPPPAASQVYELTPWGAEAEPIFQALGRWAARSPGHDPTLPISAASVLLSFRTMVQRERARGVRARIGLVMGDESFVVQVGDGDVVVTRGDVAGADAVLSAPPGAVAAAAYSGQPLAALEQAGLIAVRGDRAAAERFLTLFALPPKADARA